MTVNDIILIQNTAERSFVREFAENGLSLYTGFESTGEDLLVVKCEVPSRIIQFYFCLEGHLSSILARITINNCSLVSISSCIIRRRIWFLI